LTRNAFSSFLKRQKRSNTSEVVKSYRLEQYTTNALIQFITDRKLEDRLDLVEGGHIAVFRTEDEEQAAKRDYEAARAAGVDTADLGIRWIENKELTEVSSWFHPILLQNEPNFVLFYRNMASIASSITQGCISQGTIFGHPSSLQSCFETPRNPRTTWTSFYTPTRR